MVLLLYLPTFANYIVKWFTINVLLICVYYFYFELLQVIDDSGPSNNRGLHVVVLNQRTGMVMAQRVFDTYMDDEPLVAFLYRVSAGRILIFAVKVSTYNLVYSLFSVLFFYFSNFYQI